VHPPARRRQLLGIAAFLVERDARLNDRKLRLAEPARGPRRRLFVASGKPLLDACSDRRVRNSE
jgi:hypothetical protein